MAKFYDHPNSCMVWFGLFIYGVSHLVYSAGQAYVKEEQKCFDNTDIYDLANIPDCAALWAVIIGMAGFFVAVFLASFFCINKMKLCSLISVVLFGGAGVMGIFYLYDANDDNLIDNLTDESKAFLAAPGAYLFLSSVSGGNRRRA